MAVVLHRHDRLVDLFLVVGERLTGRLDRCVQLVGGLLVRGPHLLHRQAEPGRNPTTDRESGGEFRLLLPDRLNAFADTVQGLPELPPDDTAQFPERATDPRGGLLGHIRCAVHRLGCGLVLTEEDEREILRKSHVVLAFPVEKT